jgi:hypothetical protein
MDKMNEAIAKMAEEMKGKDYLIPFEEYLTGICTTEAVADKILKKDKKLQGAFDAMKAVAQKRKVGNCAYIPPEEGFGIIRDYYGITEADMKPAKAPESTVNVLDLL